MDMIHSFPQLGCCDATLQHKVFDANTHRSPNPDHVYRSQEIGEASLRQLPETAHTQLKTRLYITSVRWPASERNWYLASCIQQYCKYELCATLYAVQELAAMLAEASVEHEAAPLPPQFETNYHEAYQFFGPSQARCKLI